MTDSTTNYCDLKIEDSWIDYLRTRLPYSFMHISKGRPRRKPEYFQLSEPTLLTGMKAAEHHNFWKRGNVYYMTGKLMDYYSMTEAGQRYRQLAALQLLYGDARAHPLSPIDAFIFYNSMQMEKVWGFALDNDLDRERVMMTNIILSAELCLKAIMTHATFSKKGCFEFNAGHDVVKLFEGLPDSLRVEIVAESKAFARDYIEFRTRMENDILEIFGRHTSHPQFNLHAGREAEVEWNEIAERIRENTYTAFVNGNDPGKTEAQLPEDWLKKTLDRMRTIEDPHDISQYFRYAPQEDKDELPVDLITWVLLLGRFLYEHLFPMPPPENQPLSKFPIRSG